jgi:hypothetical protein
METSFLGHTKNKIGLTIALTSLFETAHGFKKLSELPRAQY